MPGDTSSMGGSQISDFFSNIRSIASDVGATYGAIRPLWTGSTAQDTTRMVQNQPTYAGNPGTSPTTATVSPPETQSTNFTPIILIGIGIIALVVLLK